ncbi:MAG TPA: hypothetical protein VMP11_02425 [Verrucomicrobiae bacterium]|nr:hypothetical protein [Verrucomicrobiae bacterium]
MKLRVVLLVARQSLALVTLGLAISDARAQSNSWINPSNGFWQDATNWALTLPPGPTQSVLITNAGAKTVLIDISTTTGYSNTLTVGDVILAGQTGATNTLFVDNIGANPPLHILNSLIVNPGGTLVTTGSALTVDNDDGAAVDVEGAMALSGVNVIGGGLYDGFATNSSASFSVIDGQTIFTNDYVAIGFYGSARFTLLSGTLQTEDNVSTPNGVFIGLGPASQGALSIPGGTLLAPEHLSLGEDAGATGHLSLTGGQLVTTNNFLISIGGSGVGQVVVSNGALSAAYVVVGDSPSAVGTLIIAGGTLSLSGSMVIAQGQGSTGSVFITGGQLQATNQGVSVNGFETGNLPVTIAGFGIGQMVISNGSLLAQSLIIGDCENSQGTLTIAGGTVSIVSNLTLGAFFYMGASNAQITVANTNASGAIQMTGGTLTVTNQPATGLLSVGQIGNGLFIQNGGQVQVDQLAIAAACSSNLGSIPGYPLTNMVWGGTGLAVISNGLFTAGNVSVGVKTNCQGGLIVANGQFQVFSNMTVGVLASSTGLVQVLGGSLYVTNQSGIAQLVIGAAGLGAFSQNGGVVTVDQLLATNATYDVYAPQIVQPLWSPVTNDTYSTFSLNSGVFNARSATVSNSETFYVGDGIDSATYHLLGGVHTFANGIEVRSNAVLSGCGTINGSVVVDSGGLIEADCGGVLTFTGIVTNNGDIVAANGTTIESYGLVVNDGVFDIINGSTNFHSGFVNNGTILTTNNVPQILSITAVGSDIHIQFTTSSNLTCVLEYSGSFPAGSWIPLLGITGPGGNVTVTDFNALLQTQRFYRVRWVVSP